MHRLAGRHGAGRGHQRLAQHLAAKNGRTADVVALATEEVVLQLLQSQQVDQALQRLGSVSYRKVHGADCPTLCRARYNCRAVIAVIAVPAVTACSDAGQR